MSREVLVATDGRGVATVTLNRPELRNAFNETLIEALRATFERVGTDPLHAFVTLLPADGIERTFRREGDRPKVEIKDPLQGHRDLLAVITDKDMHDVTAYLVTLK